jgi:hypothetical protein
MAVNLNITNDTGISLFHFFYYLLFHIEIYYITNNLKGDKNERNRYVEVYD